MTVKWRKWCRLCATSDNVDYPIFDSNDTGVVLAINIQKYLSITVHESHQLPLSVCSECFQRLSSFHQYAESCLQTQTMFNTLCTEESDKHATLVRDRYLSENKEEMRDGEKVKYKNNKFGDSNYECFENKNYEMVRIEPECLTKTRSGKRKVVAGRIREKTRGRGRPRKCEQTVPRIKIRAIPKSVKHEENGSSNISSGKSERLIHSIDTDSQEESVKKREKRPKLCSSEEKNDHNPAQNDTCSDNSDMLNENEDDDENNEEHESEVSDKDCNVNDKPLERAVKEEKYKQSKKLKKSDLKALVPALFRFQCHVCDYVCKNWNALCTHCMELHQTQAQIKCVCGKYLLTRTSIIEHRTKHTDSPVYRCDKCEKIFHRKSLLNHHVMSHVPKEEQPFVCCKCARRFHCEALLRNHERVHLPKEERLVFPCHLCHKKFSSKSAVSAHLKAIHLGERPFVCEQCGHSFTSKGILQEHLTIHSDEAPWNCSKCNKNFKTKYRLKIHMDTHRDTRYQCPKCPVQLSTRRTLRMHLVVHRDTKAYQCSTCGKAFRRAKDLKKREFKFWSNKGIKVVVLGANGHVGQNVALLLTQCSVIDELTLYDVASTAGLCMELNCIDTKCEVTHFDGRNCLKEALDSARIVVMVAGLPRNEGMTRDDLFNSNAMIAAGLAQACAEYCPYALLAVVTNPINSIVPVVCEVYKQKCHKDCSKNIFGVTTLDCVRANTFVAEVLSAKPETIVVPVVGGHSASTIVPLLSQTKPSAEFSTAEVVRITKAVQEAGDEVVKAKKKGSATLSTAYSVARFVTSLAIALTGQKSIVECAYVASNVLAKVPYLATELEFGPQGFQKNLGLPRVMSDYECCLLETCIPILQKDIAIGKDFVKKFMQTCEG